jgi:hypothetical protein
VSVGCLMLTLTLTVVENKIVIVLEVCGMAMVVVDFVVVVAAVVG